MPAYVYSPLDSMLSAHRTHSEKQVDGAERGVTGVVLHVLLGDARGTAPLLRPGRKASRKKRPGAPHPLSSTRLLHQFRPAAAQERCRVEMSSSFFLTHTPSPPGRRSTGPGRTDCPIHPQTSAHSRQEQTAWPYRVGGRTHVTEHRNKKTQVADVA